MTSPNVSIGVFNRREIKKNTLQASFDVEINAGLLSIILRGATYHESHAKRWVSMPARPYQDKNGQTCWANIVDWPTEETKRLFLDLILAAYDTKA